MENNPNTLDPTGLCLTIADAVIDRLPDEADELRPAFARKEV
jgi:hypothetical protein